MSKLRTFLEEYVDVISASLANNHTDNYDRRRFGEPPTGKRDWSWKGIVRGLLKRRGYVPVHSVGRLIVAAWRLVASNVDRFEWLYQHLADDESRELLVRVLAYRALGHRRVKLPLNTPVYWETLRGIDELADNGDYVSVPSINWRLFRMSLQPLGFPVEMYVTPQGAHSIFNLQHYRCFGKDGAIEVERGDYVVDAGACWGDAALYFAHRVGTAGKVFSFEFVPTNLEVFQTNLGLNPSLRERVTVVERALWSCSDLTVYHTDGGPGTTVSLERPLDHSGQTSTLTIDDLVQEHGVSRVDFIKMDIEGAELEALKGAVRVMRRFRPKLAISIYHHLSDFLEVPELIAGLDLGYQLYIRHFTIHSEETVLFAQAERP